MIEKVRIKQFCYCCSTRTGSLLIGIFGWIGSLVQAIILTNNVEHYFMYKTNKGLVIEKVPESNVRTILFSILIFGVSVSLVIGVYKNNRMYLLPWLAVKYFEFLVLTLITLITLFLLMITGQFSVKDIIFIVAGILAVFFWYCWTCVWSFYVYLDETRLPNIPIRQTEQAFLMTEQHHPTPHYIEIKLKSPPQEML